MCGQAADEESNLEQEGKLPLSAEAENDVRSPPDLATEEQHPVRPLVPGLMETLVGHTRTHSSPESYCNRSTVHAKKVFTPALRFVVHRKKCALQHADHIHNRYLERREHLQGPRNAASKRRNCLCIADQPHASTMAT